MFLLDRYVILNVARGIFLLAFIMITLFALVMLIEELDDVGEKRYTWALALQYIALHMPKLLLDLASFIGLVGSIVALGAMSGHREIMAMQSVGRTPNQIMISVALAAAGFMLIVLLVAQFALPASLQRAQAMKTLATEDYGDALGQSGYWSRTGRTFLNIGDMQYGRTPLDIEIYEFDKQQKLDRYITAESAEIVDARHWVLQGVEVKRLHEQPFLLNRVETLEWESFLNPTQLGVIVSSVEALSLTNLYHYVQGLKARGDPSYRHELLFWQRIMIPISSALMIILGLGFVFGSTRHVTIGQRHNTCSDCRFGFLLFCTAHRSARNLFSPACVCSGIFSDLSDDDDRLGRALPAQYLEPISKWI